MKEEEKESERERNRVINENTEISEHRERQRAAQKC